MAHDDAMTPEAEMTGPEAKLFIHLLRLNGRQATNAELMRGSGVNHRATFFRAKANLRDRWSLTAGTTQVPLMGLLSLTAGTTVSPVEPPVSPLAPGVSQVEPGVSPLAPVQSHLGNLPTPDADALLAMVRQGAVGAAFPRLRASLAGEVVPAASATTLNVPIDEETDYLAACGQVDRMDDSGETFVRNSPRNQRTRAQVQVLQAAFAQLFAKPLTEGGAKELLGLAEHSAEGVYEVLELAHTQKPDVEHPLGYVKAILRRQQQERSKPMDKLVADTRPAALDPATTQDNYYLKEPTPETKRRQDRLRSLGIRFAGDGLGPLTADEEDE